MNQHHAFSPSRLGRRLLCPGSYRMEKDLAEADATNAAAEGSLLHSWIRRTDWESAERLELLSGDELTDDQRRLIVKCVEFEGRVTSPTSVEYRERPVQLIGASGHVLSEGTADYVEVDTPSVVRVIDWKFGRIPVSRVSAVLQIGVYVGGAMQEWRAPRGEGWIYQPRLGLEYHAEFDSIEEITDAVARVIAECQKPEAPLRPSPEACEHCLAASTCPALRALATTKPVTDVERFAQVPVEDRTAIADAIFLAGTLAEKGKALLKEFIRGGGEVPGYEVTVGPGDRVVRDVLAAFASVADVLPQEKFLAVLNCPVGKLEAAYAAACLESGRTDTKKAGSAEFNRVMADVIIRKSDETSLRKIR